ncbi:MAG: 2'-5' RNA ligase family protein [Bryobacterales bacterium]|nr:2'-5' RNA ligase family protein [Bryobacterales bacterium]
MPSQLEIASDGTEWINSYALVTYIPDPLGRFLDDLRRNLAPACNPHAHVTLMPPRPLAGPADEAWDQIHECTKTLPVFLLQATEVRVFPETHVIYIELGMGREQLLELHAALNQGPLYFAEPFEYHPHITLAQELPVASVADAARMAQDTWRQCPHSRIFPVEEFTFVQSTVGKCWKDLASVQLERVSVVR